jgi:hypothetical protein
LAYATITNLLVGEASPGGADYELVVPLSLKAIRVSDIPLDQLIAFRKKDETSSGHDFRDMRHRYVDRVEAHVKAILALERVSDRQELERQFELAMADDLKQLQDELRRTGKEVIFSRDVIITAVAAISAVAVAAFGFHLDVPTAFTFAGAPVTVGGILAAQNKFASSRKSVMQKHPMAYLYELDTVR